MCKLIVSCWDYREGCKKNRLSPTSSIVAEKEVDDIKQAREFAKEMKDNTFHVTYPSGVKRMYKTWSVYE